MVSISHVKTFKKFPINVYNCSPPDNARRGGEVEGVRLRQLPAEVLGRGGDQAAQQLPAVQRRQTAGRLPPPEEGGEDQDAGDDEHEPAVQC